ncbi:hypothetical protein EDD17DRAFT_1495422 [Pisolithus thermaeus]|nr:hypothetical protein EDD17DRAFT_1495422 [Pisolithus thermaeus]
MSTQEEQPVLASPPVQLLPVLDLPARRSLKRSASVASLPTPPRTRHKRSRGQTRSPVSRHVGDEDDSDGNSASSDNSTYTTHINRVKSKSSGDEASQPLEVPIKRTSFVLSSHNDDEDEETAFWMGRKRQKGEHGKRESEVGEPLDSSPRPALLHYSFKGPVSPPPSRRQPRALPNRAVSIEPSPAAPSTPPRKLFLRASPLKTPTRKAKKTWPKQLPARDSPDNPFLNNGTSVSSQKRPTGWDSSDDEAREAIIPEPVRKDEPTSISSYGEKPTITYVFRGQKATMTNPMYSVSAAAEAASRLPIDHPDYEPLEVCPPRRLFFSGGKRESKNSSGESVGFSDGAKRGKSHLSRSDGEDPQLAGEECLDANVDKKSLLPHDEDREPVFTKPPRESSQHRTDPEQESDAREALRRVREERERRVRADKERLGQTEGLRAGAVVAERDDPIRRACGPPR